VLCQPTLLAVTFQLCLSNVFLIIVVRILVLVAYHWPKNMIIVTFEQAMDKVEAYSSTKVERSALLELYKKMLVRL
jgi:hypothetical protein